MKSWKKVLLGVAAVLGLALLGGGAFAGVQVMAFDDSMSKVYEVPLPAVQRSTDPAVLERGKHLAESIGGCLECHGKDLGGALMADMGPVGVIHAPNITGGGLGAKYSDAEIVRLLRDGLKRDGRSVTFMPSADFRWWPESDLVAVVSFVRTLPPVKRVAPASSIGPLGKVLDRLDKIPIDIARRIDHTRPPEVAPAPAPTVEYGRFIGKLCQGCHGPTLSGGPIPGAPPDMPVPTNITPHQSGLAGYGEEDFYRVLDTGVRPDGRKLDPMMPVATLAAMNDVEKKALWLYLRSVPARPFGGR
jgi:mono/diheme cytochrome c family protein